MTNPVWDFVRGYAASEVLRAHMPGHKGRALLGCEPYDLTEVAGADTLDAPSGILAESERNAAALFGSARSCLCTEGSSQCVRAMVYLALLSRAAGTPPRLLAARNVHKSFVYACALCGAEVDWLWPERRSSLCGCGVPPAALEAALARLDAPPAAVYVTSPDYLGALAEVGGLAEVCRARALPLLVDNAHGAYLRFLPRSLHPLDAGAALCCDSAHKTLPVLTGGAWLHVGRDAPAAFAEGAKRALDLFCSTSPSYLTLASLDRCQADLAGGYPRRLAETAEALAALRLELRRQGWTVADSDPLRLTLSGDGAEAAARLRRAGIEPEYAGRDGCVLMLTPENPPETPQRIARALGNPPEGAARPPELPLAVCPRACTLREAVFSPQVRVPVREAAGRICGAPAVSCPPAVPVAVSGERLTAEAVELMEYYGIRAVSVLA